jgi:ASC-1-like (ASCH) protein
MSRWVLPLLEENRQVFDLLSSGKKTVETMFTCGDDKLERQVVSVRSFGSIEDLFAAIPIQKVMPWVRSREEAAEAYYGFPGYVERIAEFGIVAFEIKLLTVRFLFGYDVPKVA